jgi:hypothetical protein
MYPYCVRGRHPELSAFQYKAESCCSVSGQALRAFNAARAPCGNYSPASGSPRVIILPDRQSTCEIGIKVRPGACLTLGIGSIAFEGRWTRISINKRSPTA